MKTTFLTTTLSYSLLAAGFWHAQTMAQTNSDEGVAVDVATAQGLNFPEIRLKPVSSQEVIAKKGTPTERICNVLLYAHAPNHAEENSMPWSTLYLVLQMGRMGSELDALHIVGAFYGYPDHTELFLVDLDGDEIPEVVMRYLAGTDAVHMRIFRFAKNPNIYKAEGNLPISAVLPQTAHFISGLGGITLTPDGMVVIKDYADESRKKLLPLKKYRMMDGVMKEVEK